MPAVSQRTDRLLQLVSVLMRSRGPVACAVAAEELALLLRDLPVDELPPLAKRLGALRRWTWRSCFGLDPSAAEARRVARLVLPADTDALALGAISCLDNGYVREAAVRRLARATPSAVEAALPFLLLRANDWVDEVRVAARTALEGFLLPVHATAWARALPMVDRLRAAGRADHRTLIARVEELVTAAPAALGVALRTGGRSARQCLASAGRRGLAVPHALITAALGDRDVRLRLAAARFLAAGLLEPLRAELPRLERDPFPPVRIAALDATLARLPERADAVLRAALCDRSGSVRWRALFLRRGRDPDFDARAFYRAVLAEGALRPSKAAAAMLGALGKPADGEILLRLLDDPRVGLRRTALRALARLTGGLHLDRLRAELESPARGVSRAACEALEPYARRLDDDALGRLLEAPHAHVRQHSLRLLCSGERWVALRWLLRASRSADGALRAASRARLERWEEELNRCYAPLDDTRREGLRRLLAAARDLGSLRPRLRDVLTRL